MRRYESRLRRAAVIVAAAALLAACTGNDPTADPSRSASPSASASQRTSTSRVLANSDGVKLAAGVTPAAIAAAASRALFVSSPLVVVAAPSDAASVSAAAVQAERLGVPLLLGGGGGDDDAAAEIARLGATRALLVGAPVADLPHGVEVVTDPAAVGRPDGDAQHPTLVLVPAKPQATEAVGVQAATATAKAAGATVVGVSGDDPRADRKAIEALAKQAKAGVTAIGAEFGPQQRLAQRVGVARTGVQLPGGGQVMFPGRRLVALYGHPGSSALGVLGEQGIGASITRARAMAANYAPLSNVPVVPAFEIIATVAQKSAGRDGNYSGEASVAKLKPWVEEAVENGLYVILDLQPGRADPLDQAKLYADLLAMPNVGLAIDAEWALGPNQLPLRQIGSLDASAFNRVGAWLDAFTAQHHLPQKVFVLHQFRLSMIANEENLRTDFDNVALLIHMDGQGSTPDKMRTWKAVTGAAPVGVPFGWKNFYDEDHPMLTPSQTMAVSPKPLMISYQ